MATKISEKSFEDDIERALLSGGPDAVAAPGEIVEPAAAYGDMPPGGYLRRTSADYDRGLCLIPRDVLDFVVATQPKTWERLREHHGAEVKPRFLRRLAREIGRRGTLDVLRKGVKDSGCGFRLAYFRPASGLNPETERLYEANLFSVVRQLFYSETHHETRNPSLDLALFLNGLPLFTAELKNPLSGQNVEDAVKQYKSDRDPREPLFAFGRCLAHFAVDPDLVYLTTRLAGDDTYFLPFNRGWERGAGNPPTARGYATRYLWDEIWARDSVLDLLRQFIHVVRIEDDKGKKTGERRLIFPRYHQLDTVRRLVADARGRGPGGRYLIEHSAGSGKSNSIAWLAHQLSTLHGADDRRVFDSIIVVTDRRVLDRQLQRTLRQFEQTLGVVENIDRTSAQLKDALAAGKTIIVSTLQKFPQIVGQLQSLPGQSFAVIVDEAHSSQSGESAAGLKQVLAAGSLEEAEAEEAGEREDFEDRLVAELRARGPLANVSTFAFTATPKAKTLELFGTRRPDGRFAPFSLYSMRQAIEENFILDVLANYTTYTTYWRLLKTVEDDPHYDRKKASYLLRSFVDLHPHAIDRKLDVMVDHFAQQVQGRIAGKAKAMIVTRSRLHAVRYKLALDALLAEKDYPWKALVAFSGVVADGGTTGKTYTEAGMNGLPERQTAATFKRPEVRFLVVAEKFQTGFDQPLLHTMYVDKKLAGIHAVQTLSRLNRTHRDKEECLVLDFVNEAESIRQAFQPFYETTLLSEGTDPNLPYDLQGRLLDYGVYTEDEVHAFARLYFGPEAGQGSLYAALAEPLARYRELAEAEQGRFRKDLGDYRRLYAYLSQILTFDAPDLLELYHFARYLRRRIGGAREELPREVQEAIDMESYRVQRTSRGRIRLERGPGIVEPRPGGGEAPGAEALGAAQLEPLSRIVADLNERFGIELTEADRVCLDQVFTQLQQDPALEASSRVNTRENARLTFDHKLEDTVQEIVDSNFKLYKRITDDREFGRTLADHLFDEYLRRHRAASELIGQGESKTLELKSTLRWNLKEERKDPVRITHAVLKTLAAFLNTEGGDLLIGVSDGGEPLGLAADRFESDDKLLLHLSQVTRNALGARASTCIDPRIQLVEGTPICLVACQRSPEPVFLKWKGTEASAEGDFFVRSGPGTVKLSADDAREYIATRFPQRSGAS